MILPEEDILPTSDRKEEENSSSHELPTDTNLATPSSLSEQLDSLSEKELKNPEPEVPETPKKEV